PYGMDEAWLEVGGLLRDESEGRLLADTLRDRMRNQLGLTISVGVSFNMIYAKLGSDFKKPDATTVFDSKHYKDEVWKLPAYEMLFVGKSTRHKLYEHGILSIGDLANADPVKLIQYLGKLGYTLWRFANGDDREFKPETETEADIKSIGNTITPPRDLLNKDDVSMLLYVLCGTVASRLKIHNFNAGTLSIGIKDNLFNSFQRQKKLYIPSCNHGIIYKTATELFDSNYKWVNPVRCLNIRADNLISEQDKQYTLIDEETLFEKEGGNLMMTDIAEKIRRKFGHVDIEKTGMLRDLEVFDDYNISTNNLNNLKREIQ
ncbi:MAG: polymerase, partial [Clostridia bacterium]|nr:polymerase [Clostridia bacterium]